MAVLKCPECGGTVSSTTDQCVHCGCKFVVCPECGAAHLKGIQKCSECGYAFAEEKSNVNVAQEPTEQGQVNFDATSDQEGGAQVDDSVPSVTETIAKWEIDGPHGKYSALKALSTVTLVFAIIGLVLGAVLSVLGLRGMVSVSALHFGLWCALLGGVGIALHSVLLKVSKMLAAKEMWLWAQNANVDLVPIMECSLLKEEDKEMSISNTMKYVKNFVYMLSAQYTNSTSTSHAKEIIFEIVQFFWMSVEAILIVVFVFANATVIGTSPFSFGQYNFVPVLVIIIASLIVRGIVSGRIEKKRRETISDWAKNIFSEEAHKKFIESIKNSL